MSTRPQTTGRARSILLTALIGQVMLTTPSAAQLSDPYTVPGGALRVSFRPEYMNWRQLFDADGDRFRLGTFFSTDTLGAPFLPTVAAPQDAVRSILAEDTYRMNAGAFTARLDGDIRRFPFEFALGLSNRLTFDVTVPIVTTRVNSRTTLDTAGANVGWNQVSGPAGNPQALTDITILLGELAGAAAALDAEIGQGSFGCPAGPQCDAARALADRIRQLAADVATLTGVQATGEPDPALPPFAPLASSPAGVALADVLAAVTADLQALGQTGLSVTLPLPATAVDGDAVDQIVTADGFGYDAHTLDPPEASKLSRIGDVEVGLRYALAQGPTLRAVLGARARLPTGFRDLPDDYLDIGPGQRQLDLEWTLDAAIEPGNRLGLWLDAAYTLQLGDRLTQRIAPPDAPLAPASTATEVDRNLGDILRAGVHPLLRLNQNFRVFVSAIYYRKGADSYALGGTRVPELESLTEMETWSFGAGIWYRADRGRRAGTLPIEAGLTYRSAFSGSGGRTPKSNALQLSLRLYYRLWGRGAFGAEAPEESPTQG